MARPATFTREMIVAAATELVAREGAAALSTRRVAEQLGASTAPIYASFESVDDLYSAVVGEARARLRAATRAPWSERPFLNQGTGVVLFARDEPHLFALLFLTPEVARRALPHVLRALAEDMRADARFTALGEDERTALLEQMWFVAVGMATLVHAGQLRDPSTEGILRALLDAGGAIIPAALERAKKRR